MRYSISCVHAVVLFELKPNLEPFMKYAGPEFHGAIIPEILNNDTPEIVR
jgi:hypothetical protein